MAARTENRTMRHKDSAAKMAALPVRRGSYQQPSATRQKKREAKKRKSPCTPFREKAKGKESDRRVLSRNRLSRADARATARSAIAPYPGLDRLVAAALDADLDTAVGAFAGSADDRRIWASIAWRVGVRNCRKRSASSSSTGTAARTRCGRFWRRGDAPPGMPPRPSIGLT